MIAQASVQRAQAVATAASTSGRALPAASGSFRQLPAASGSAPLIRRRADGAQARRHLVVSTALYPDGRDGPCQSAGPLVAALVAAPLLFGGVASPAVAGEMLLGRPEVVDGDTLKVSGERIRLFGIDAPESKQSCKNGKGQEYACGKVSTEALAKRIGSGDVVCDVKNKDMYGRSVASCAINGKEDIGTFMTSNGYAVAYTQYSKDYVSSEDAARKAKRGVWEGSFQVPSEWRKEQKALQREVAANPVPAPPKQPPTGVGYVPPNPKCPIKGNISAKGEKIYHVPGGRVYDSTQIVEGDGEKWFCSEAEAAKAGWRASKV